jgi:hypothetical protein
MLQARRVDGQESGHQGGIRRAEAKRAPREPVDVPGEPTPWAPTYLKVRLWVAGRESLDGRRAPRPADVLPLVDLGPESVERSDFFIIGE